MGVVFLGMGVPLPCRFVEFLLTCLPQHPNLVIEEILHHLLYGSSTPFFFGFP